MKRLASTSRPHVVTLLVLASLAACGGGGGGVFYSSDLARGGGGGDGPPPDLTTGGGETPDMAINQPPSCADGIRNGGESDRDCGGRDCGPCADGQRCLVNGDCTSGRCVNGTCAPPMMPPSCVDGLMNGLESDVDCGGADCPACANGKKCKLGSDCVSATCSAGRCANPQPKGPVGAVCKLGTDCTGTSAQCYTTIPMYMIPTPGGYCSNSNCGDDTDCGNGGFCDTDSSLCFGECSMANQCQKINPANRCYYFDQAHPGACLPAAGLSDCDPTKNVCLCRRSGVDNVGRCAKACTLPNSCAVGEVCNYFNATIDANGMATGDLLSGLVCLKKAQNQFAADQACTYINECAPGYECDFFKVGGAKLCKEICKLGTTVCTKGTCKNGFKLPNFVNGSIGLCL